MNSSTLQESKSLIPVKPLQIIQINLEAIPIDGIIRSGDPIEPMVSAQYQQNVNGMFINIRIMVFMPKTLLGQEPISLYQDTETAKNELKFIVKCNNAELTASEYYSWYVNYMHPVADFDTEIDITTHIENMFPDDSNPKTSRGTVTRVLQS